MKFCENAKALLHTSSETLGEIVAVGDTTSSIMQIVLRQAGRQAGRSAR